MASESIKILLEAEDLASAQVATATKAIEANVKSVKETGQKAKGSLEFVGVMAGQLGAGQLQSAAQGVAAITEKIGQFSEVQKLGGKAAGFFQAGLIALVATMSFQLGKSIGEAIFGVKNLGDELEQLTEQYRQQTDVAKQLAGIKFSEQVEDLSLIKDPKKQQSEAVALFKAVEQERNKALQTAEDYQARVDKINESEWERLGNIGKVSQAERDRANEMQLTANAQRELAAEYDNELAALSKLYGPRAKQIEAIKAQQAAEDQAAQKKKQIDDSALSSLRSINYQYIELTKGQEAARRAQMEDQGMSQIQIDRILFAEKALGIEKQLAETKRKAQDEENARLQKVADLRKSELDRLEEQRIALEQGEKAAHAFRLTQQGLDADTANAIANAQAAMEEASKAKQIEQVQPLAGQESRMLTRGPQQDKIGEVAKYSKMTAEQSALTKEAIDKLRAAVEKDAKAKQDKLNVQVIGGAA